MYLEAAVGLYLAGSFIYHRWIEDKPSPYPNAIATPRIDEGAPVPLIYGKCRVRAPILAWAGSQRNIPIKDGRAGVTRIAYLLDMLYVVGIPFFGGGATLSAIYAGDTLLTLHDPSENNFTGFTVPLNGGFIAGRSNYWVNNTPARVFTNDLAVINNVGFVEFLDGRPTQTISDGVDDDDDAALTDTQAVLEAEALNFIYIYHNPDNEFEDLTYPPLPQNFLPSQIPSFRNFALCCLYHWSNGDSTDLHSYGFEVSAMSTGTAAHLGNALADDADPAAILIDVLTSPWSKLGLGFDKIDTPSFQAASNTLFGEEHGYSRSIEQQEEATAVIADVLRQTDGVMYVEPTTGKLVYKLIRFDYSVGSLDDINPDNAVAAGSAWYQVQGWSETLNQVRLSYTDRFNMYADGIVVAQNAANAVNQGSRIRSIDIQFKGCCTRTLAQKLASRELAAVSRPQVKATVIADQSFYGARPGSVYTFTWPKLGIDKMVMRVARVNFGTRDNPGITLDLIRDIFDVSLGAYPIP